MDSKELLNIQNIELKLLISAMHMMYGYDFENYTKTHIKRRVIRRLKLSNYKSIAELTEKLLYDKKVFEQLLMDLSINVTEMFRFPQFFNDLRQHVIPILKTYPHINVWHVGCSSGEEVLSVAILLKEEGLLGKTRIYATDINKGVLDIAKEGIYPVSEVRKWTKNYQKAGGKKSFSHYYTAKFNSVIFNQDLLENTTFHVHNLVQDKKFISANLIICRNVMIYFNKTLTDSVLELLESSLIPRGVLGVGSKESIKFTSVTDKFDVLGENSKIYIKKVGMW